MPARPCACKGKSACTRTGDAMACNASADERQLARACTSHTRVGEFSNTCTRKTEGSRCSPGHAMGRNTCPHKAQSAGTGARDKRRHPTEGRCTGSGCRVGRGAYPGEGRSVTCGRGVAHTGVTLPSTRSLY